MFKREREFDRFLVCFMDLLCVVLSYSFTLKIPYNDLTENSLVLIVVTHIAIFYLGNYYHDFYKRGALDELKSVVIYELHMVITMTVLIFISKGEFNISRRGMMYFVISNFLIIYLMHLLIKQYRIKVYPEKTGSKKVYLVTTKARAKKILDRIETTGSWDGKIVAIALFDDVNGTIKEIEGIPVVAGRDDYISYAYHNIVDEVFINLPGRYKIDMEDVITQFEVMGVAVSFSMNAFELKIDCDKRVKKLAGYSVITFSSNNYKYGDLIIKRAVDIIGSLVGLAITSVVGIILIPLIKIESSGPAIFAQDRVGKNGRVFKFYKFRSMYADAEERKAELLAANEMSGLMFKMENDPRITKIGKFIRKTSIDELPQFYNVLRGDMSLVGTRPPTLDEYNQYEAYQKRRLSAKPGITGMWQVSGRSDITDFEEVIELDLEYIDHWSIWLDVKILIKTLKVILLGDGAR